ncbi:hypothetical protein Gpo141_00011385 [Globisporangium polare]
MAHEMHVFPSTRRRRRSSGSVGGVRIGGGVSAAFVAVCCSTLMLQVLTTTAPEATDAKATIGATDLFDALLTRVSSSVRASLVGKSADSEDSVRMRLDDMHISNVSVHRVRYVANDDSAAPSSSSDGENEKARAREEKDGANSESDGDWNGSRPEAQHAQEDATESFMGRWTRKVGFLSSERKRAEVTSVVVTWDDNFRSVSGDESDAVNKKTSGRVVTYELQHWVNGWGFDALWHPSNRKLTVADPFVVLSNLPQEHEIAFRVRMKVKKTSGLLSGLFATETDGPWSAVALLSPSRGDALEAIFVFLASNKAFFLVLLMCIGSGSLVVFKQLVSHRFLWLRRCNKRVDLASNSALATTGNLSAAYPVKSATSRRSSNGSRSAASGVAAGGGNDLEQEIKDLRQELADSEAEVRQLMVFRGYGVERLSSQELALVEQELRVTLQRIQKLQKSGPKSRNSSDEDTDEDEEGEPQQRRRKSSVSSSSNNSRNGSGAGTGGAHARRRRLGAVFEVDDASC